MTTPTQPGMPQAGAAAPDPAAGSRRDPGSPRPQNRAAGRPRGGLGTVARQFAGPSGPAGHLVTWLLARGNASFNRWLVREVAAAVPAPSAVIELGCGPGVALAELLRAYPAARIIGADPSAVATTSARRRNARAFSEGRLTLVTGDTSKAAGYAPAGLILACHVLYFWPDPVAELQRIREILAPSGHIALGYQLRQNMPPLAQRTFPGKGSPSTTTTTRSPPYWSRQASPAPRSASSAPLTVRWGGLLSARPHRGRRRRQRGPGAEWLIEGAFFRPGPGPAARRAGRRSRPDSPKG